MSQLFSGKQVANSVETPNSDASNGAIEPPALCSWASEMSFYSEHGENYNEDPSEQTQKSLWSSRNKLERQRMEQTEEVPTTETPKPSLQPETDVLTNNNTTTIQSYAEPTANSAAYTPPKKGNDVTPTKTNSLSPSGPRPGDEAMTIRSPSSEPRPGDDDFKPVVPEFDKRNLIINYLPPGMTSEGLKDLFSQYGTIVNCKVVVDHNSGLSKGFGFVKYNDETSAKTAINKLNGYQIDKKTLKVSLARKNCKKGEGEQGYTNLYIANLDRDINEKKLRGHFSKCGYIVQCRVLQDSTGKSRQIGFVRYDTHTSALRAIRKFDNKILKGAKNIIQCRFANTPRGRRFDQDKRAQGRFSHQNEAKRNGGNGKRMSAASQTQTTIATKNGSNRFSRTESTGREMSLGTHSNSSRYEQAEKIQAERSLTSHNLSDDSFTTSGTPTSTFSIGSPTSNITTKRDTETQSGTSEISITSELSKCNIKGLDRELINNSIKKSAESPPFADYALAGVRPDAYGMQSPQIYWTAATTWNNGELPEVAATHFRVTPGEDGQVTPMPPPNATAMPVSPSTRQVNSSYPLYNGPQWPAPYTAQWPVMDVIIPIPTYCGYMTAEPTHIDYTPSCEFPPGIPMSGQH